MILIKLMYIMASYFQGGVAETELLRVVKERDELKAALLDFEKHIEDIQDNVKGLSAERDRFKTLLKQVSFINLIPPGGQTCYLTILRKNVFITQAQDDLKLARSSDRSADRMKLKEEVRQAEIRIQQMSIERDTLMERLKVS